ncbi:MAG: sulfatase [Planctomycetes bacterium]|nr:sulfatase [Planctomycetota bacterium]MCB9910144.1 sulfatase [Planctomycetota bacterium]MCB9913089.1 sulfatase [Planctomycetota bacterium]HRV80298.1 sulfatase [Planctomycetota bacterium]
MSRILTLLLAFGALGLVGCPAAKPAKPNVLWIVVDTLRADRLGSERGLTPYMDRLGQKGVVFENAFSQAPWTLPSIASMMTSLYPKEHGAGGRLGAFQSVHEGIVTAPSVFQRAGYTTHAIVNVEFLKQKYGVTRDFQEVDVAAFENNVELRNAEKTTDAALAYMAQQSPDKPFFLLLHYFDVHAVYDPPQPFRSRYAAPPDRESGPGRTLFGTREEMMALRAGKLELSREWIARAAKLYDGEVAYTDAEIGRLMDRLGGMGLLDNTLIVLCADHGEEFLDHGGFEHGHTVYDELIHVPLMLVGPGAQAGLRVPQTVRMIDVLPTLCQWADVAGERQFAGKSLMPFLEGKGGESRRALAHGNMWGPPHTALRDGGWKLIESGDGSQQLFHVAEDAREQKNLATQDTQRLEDLRQELSTIESAMSVLGKGKDVQLTPEELESLKASGYGGGE